MPYFPVDDDMAFHPKFIAAGNEATGLWTRAGALCKKYATGGFVSTEVAASLGPSKVARKLVDVGLWDAVDGGYRFHDWEHQAGNSDAETEKARRDANAARQRAWRARNASRNDVANGVNNDDPSPSPSPSPKGLTSNTSHSQSHQRNANANETDGLDIGRVRTAISRHLGILDVPSADEVAAIAAHLIAKSPKRVSRPEAFIEGCDGPSVRAAWDAVKSIRGQIIDGLGGAA